MNGRISAYRGGVHTQYNNQVIVHVEGVESFEDAKKLVGKKVSWTAPGAKKTTLTGEVRATHGKAGHIRVLFSKGMPGQSLGTQVVVQ